MKVLDDGGELSGRARRSLDSGRVNPLTGLAAAGTVVVACLAWGSPILWSCCLAFTVTLVARLGLTARVLPAVGLIVAPFLVWSFLIHGFFSPEGGSAIAELGPVRITVEGLSYAAAVSLRTASVVVVMLLFSAWVDVPTLRSALGRAGVPPQFGFVLASSLGLSSVVAGRLAGIREAQEARGLVIRSGFRHRILAARLQLLPLFFQLVEDAGERGLALESRGIGLSGRRTSYQEVPDSRLQRMMRGALLGAAILLVLSAIGAGRA